MIISQSVQVGRVTPCAPPVANQRVRRAGDCPPYQFCFSKIANRKACAEICRAKDAKKICGALSATSTVRWNSKSYAMKFKLHKLNHNWKPERSARLNETLLHLMPNCISPDAVAKIMPSRCQSVNRSCGNSNVSALNKTPLCKSGIKNQCNVMTTYLI